MYNHQPQVIGKTFENPGKPKELLVYRSNAKSVIIFCYAWIETIERLLNASKTPPKCLKNAYEKPPKNRQNPYKMPSKRPQNSSKMPPKRL